MIPGDISITNSFNPLFFSGILGLEAAGYYHGLNYYGLAPAQFLVNIDRAIYSDYIVFVPKVFSTDDELTQIGEKLYVTNPERTVCELIVADGDEEMLYTTLDGYIRKYGTEELLKCARKYNCEELVQHRIDTVQEYMDDMLNY
jgi:hypothetical protein